MTQSLNQSSSLDDTIESADLAGNVLSADDSAVTTEDAVSADSAGNYVRAFNVPLADRPMPNFAAAAGRNRYSFDQIKVGQYMRYQFAPKSPEAVKIRAAANSWARKNVGTAVFNFEDEPDAICVWRVA